MCKKFHNDWILVEEMYIPFMATKSAAPQAVLELTVTKMTKINIFTDIFFAPKSKVEVFFTDI
jgi:hypothetical protein